MAGMILSAMSSIVMGVAFPDTTNPAAATNRHDPGFAWLPGMLFGIFLGLLGALIFPVLASRAVDPFREGPPASILGLFIVATLANVFGAVLMGIPMITKRIYPRWCGYVLILAAARPTQPRSLRRTGPPPRVLQPRPHRTRRQRIRSLSGQGLAITLSNS